jgi:hypothetical protein
VPRGPYGLRREYEKPNVCTVVVEPIWRGGPFGAAPFFMHRKNVLIRVLIAKVRVTLPQNGGVGDPDRAVRDQTPPERSTFPSQWTP